jgi:hypothetical protein
MINYPMKSLLPFTLRWLFILAAMASPFLASGQDQPWMLPRDSEGWSILTPSSDSRLIYVSSSQGNDSTAQVYSTSQVGSDPRSPSISVNAFQTYSAAVAQMRDGYPDWILFRCDDTFQNVQINMLGVGDGRSASERIVVTYYDDGGPLGDRPLLLNSEIRRLGSSDPASHWAFVGLHIYNDEVDPNSANFNPAIEESSKSSLLNGGLNLLIEDCVFEFHGMSIQGPTNPDALRAGNIEIRRNIIVDTYYNDSCADKTKRPSGIYMIRITNVLVEENVFDHNGWNEDVSGAGRSTYNHNLYMSDDMQGDVISRGNINARASANASQWRSGAIVEKNLYIQNPAGVFIGHNERAAAAVRVRFNVVLEGLYMGTCTWASGANYGISLDVADFLDFGTPVTVEENIIAHNLESPANGALSESTAPEFSYIDNIIYDWKPDRDMWDAGWTAPERSVGSYHASIGGTATTEAFLQAARGRALRDWAEELSAYAVINYIREGFNLSALQPGPEPYVAVTSISLDRGSMNLYPGWSAYLYPTVSPELATNRNIVWSSSDTSVATVNVHGLVTGVAAGQAVITATTVDGSFTANCSLYVTDEGWLEDFSDLPNGTDLDTGSTAWSVSAPGIHAEAVLEVVDGRFNAYGLEAEATWISEIIDIDGAADIYVQWEAKGGMELADYVRAYYKLDGGPEVLFADYGGTFSNRTDSVSVNGNDVQVIVRFLNTSDTEKHYLDDVSVLFLADAPVVPVSGLVVSPSSVSLTVSQTAQMSKTVSPGNATDQSVTWSTSNASVATVDASGLVTAVGLGTVTITATSNDNSTYSDSCVVMVTSGGGSSSNVALGASVTASAYQDDVGDSHPPGDLVDGDTSDNERWSAQGYSQWALLDLGDQYDLSEVRLYPYQSRAYQYIVEVSADGSSYTTVADRSSNTQNGSVLTDTISATGRYVRLTVTGASGYGGGWVSINELEVDGELAAGPEPTNVALNQSVTFSNVDVPNDKLVDGSTADTDRWSAQNFPQWALIDLGAQYDLSQIDLYPYQDRDYQYTVEVSTDGSSYTTVVDRSSNTEGGNVLSDTVSTTARYVRLTVTDGDDYSGFWVSINELEVYGIPAN